MGIRHSDVTIPPARDIDDTFGLLIISQKCIAMHFYVFSLAPIRSGLKSLSISSYLRKMFYGFQYFKGSFTIT